LVAITLSKSNVLSKCFLNTEEAIKRIQNDSLHVQTCLFERYMYALDILKDDRLFKAPLSIDALFRWFFIDLWERPNSC